MSYNNTKPKRERTKRQPVTRGRVRSTQILIRYAQQITGTPDFYQTSLHIRALTGSVLGSGADVCGFLSPSTQRHNALSYPYRFLNKQKNRQFQHGGSANFEGWKQHSWQALWAHGTKSQGKPVSEVTRHVKVAGKVVPGLN
jgi:hypothetical protein